jgi:hypothetical protein
VRRDHHGQLIVEARVGASAAWQAQVDGGELIGPQGAEVVLDARAQAPPPSPPQRPC